MPAHIRLEPKNTSLTQMMDCIVLGNYRLGIRGISEEPSTMRQTFEVVVLVDAIDV